MLRLDKYLCDLNCGTRSQVKEMIKNGAVTINGTVTKKPESKVNELTDQVTLHGKALNYQSNVYYLLNKPKGTVSAVKDNTAPTVISLLPKDLQARGDIFPVGRLDKDTQGLLLLTNDGALSHKLLAPNRHVQKTYLVGIAHPLSAEDKARLEEGVLLYATEDEKEDFVTAPAKVEILSDTQILLTIHEGKFHQIKRMLRAVDNRVEDLKRVAFGPLVLGNDLKPGEGRELTNEEIRALYEA